MSSNEVVISVNNLSKRYEIYAKPGDRLRQFVLPRLQKQIGLQPQQYYREFAALTDISFDVKKGETVGIIGRNGSGKSTLLQIICGTLTPTSGAVQLNGRIAALLELGSGFNPEFTGRENIYMNATVLGLSKEEIDSRFEEIVLFADIGDFIDQPVKTYSSGMYVRLAFAVVVHVDADILIVDEALSVGDAFFQAKCMSRMRKIVENGTTVLFVSHDINAVKALCKRTLWIDQGVGKIFGKTVDVTLAYGQDWIKQANAQHLIKDEYSIEDANDKKNYEFGQVNFQTVPDLRFSSRSGTGHAQYIAFQGFCGSIPIGVEPIEFGSELRLIGRIKINEICERLVVAVHIKDSNNQHLVGVHTGAMLELYDRFWKQGEQFDVEFKLPICLHAGRYAITALISSMSDIQHYSDVKFIDWMEDVNVFEVAKRNNFPLSDLVEVKYEVKFATS